jgi:hypothetical protein
MAERQKHHHRFNDSPCNNLKDGVLWLDTSQGLAPAELKAHMTEPTMRYEMYSNARTRRKSNETQELQG